MSRKTKLCSLIAAFLLAAVGIVWDINSKNAGSIFTGIVLGMIVMQIAFELDFKKK